MASDWKRVVIFGVALLVTAPLVWASKIHEAYFIAILVAGLPGFLSSKSEEASSLPVATRATAPSAPETPDAKKG